jgi:hypothetical protein
MSKKTQTQKLKRQKLKRRQAMKLARPEAALGSRLLEAAARFEASETVFRNVALARFSFLEQVGSPEYVDVKVWAKAESGQCHRDVMNYVAEHSGSDVQGYRVYENDYQLNGEVHAVWKSPSGTLLDISPPWSPRCDADPTCMSKVTFIPLDELAPGLAYARKGFAIYYDAEVLIERQRPFLEHLVGDGWADWAQRMRDQEGVVVEGDR